MLPLEFRDEVLKRLDNIAQLLEQIAKQPRSIEAPAPKQRKPRTPLRTTDKKKEG